MDFLLNKFDESWDTPTNLDEKMKDLKRKQAELNALKGDTKSRTTAELHPRKKLKKEVELWLENVERINGEIQDLEQKIGENSFASRGFLKGNVLKKIQEVDELYQRGKFPNSLVVDNPGWIGQALSTTTLFGGAAKTCMEEIWACLMDNDIQKIGVWGMGGIGKTTIMKLVHNQLLRETERFDIVIWITVSKEMNIIKLQNRIARAMKVSLDEDEDETIRAGMIYEMLARKGKYVLILDDLWDKLSLEEVGIPEPSNGSKLVVTTRLLDVCHYLNCREVRVPTLSNPDAWSLFLKKVGEDVSNHPNLLPIMESVAKECGGLPLAIVTIASSMKGVRDVHAWRDALHELKRNGETVKKMEEKVFQQLQFSYDRLRDEELKNCFLCCALFPEDWEIETDELIHLWIVEGHIKEMDSMQQEIDKGRTILDELKSSCLIENGYKGGGRVKLHDVLRDMALRITSVRPRFLVKAGMELNRLPDVGDWNEDLEKASLMWNGQLQIPSRMPPPKCPKLTTLLLSGCNLESIPECFFEQMHGLKILDLSWNSIKSLPNSICNLETLTTLLLGWCEQLEKVPSFSKLQALKKLDLSRTTIKHIPHGMERLVNLKYLDLSNTQITEMADGILAKLTSLQHLAAYEADSGHKFFVRGEEIGGLRKLELFEGCLLDWNEWNSCAQGLHARAIWPHQYIIYVGHQFKWNDYFGDSKKVIEFRGCDMICTIGIKILSDVEVLNIRECSVDLCEEESLFSWFIPMPHNNFSSLSRIDIHGCENIKKLFSSNWVLHNLQNLNTLGVGLCWDMEEIIASESEVEGAGNGVAIKLTFPRLKKLELWDLPKLKSICGANGVMVCDSIELIEISDCPELKRIPLHLPLQDDGQPSPPSSLRRIQANTKWWESVEWDHPHAKSLLEPYFHKLELIVACS
ncbi:probable disease resistance protein At1g61300 isoform X2 [Durio zibethinus]|uniref:Probable disease resistance protein At1g61300 isoform X2 n=1 Tax=Durio zibethinus TaxID=66656 RepID=A0A6P5Y279_DURZI|nr:probable disease resistance protein At1g61300 isoform X2 [Durio zibethinus]